MRILPLVQYFYIGTNKKDLNILFYLNNTPILCFRSMTKIF